MVSIRATLRPTKRFGSRVGSGVDRLDVGLTAVNKSPKSGPVDSIRRGFPRRVGRQTPAGAVPHRPANQIVFAFKIPIEYFLISNRIKCSQHIENIT